MDAQAALLITGSVVGAAGVAVLAAALLRGRRTPQDVPAFEVVPEEPKGVPVHDLDAHPFSIAQPPRHEAALVAVAPAAPMVVERARTPMPLPPILREARTAPAPPPPPVPTEWARRQVGPPEPGRTKGACSGCGAMLSVSDQRPLRIACPVCGRTRLLA